MGFRFICINLFNDQLLHYSTMYTEADILKQLDLAFKRIANEYYPEANSNDIHYNFFLDLEAGYCVIASSRIHLYADESSWAIIFETNGYQNRALRAEITLTYVGNCIEYNREEYPERTYISNTNLIELISFEEFARIENKPVGEERSFELIDADVKAIQIRDQMVAFNTNPEDYEKLGIEMREFDNPQRLISYEDVLRYFNETNPDVISATEEELRQCIPKDLPKLMTIDSFHFVSIYEEDHLPSTQETYQLIAKVLVTQDPSSWQPTQAPNNHWSNWESGGL